MLIRTLPSRGVHLGWLCGTPGYSRPSAASTTPAQLKLVGHPPPEASPVPLEGLSARPLASALVAWKAEVCELWAGPHLSQEVRRTWHGLLCARNQKSKILTVRSWRQDGLLPGTAPTDPAGAA